MFESVIENSTLSLKSALICIAASLVLGLTISLAYMVKNTYSKGFIMSLALLPLTVMTVIIMVNGNLGVGVAVAGAFSLVRFRSLPGSAKDICAIFMSMAIGLATGTGYIAYAVLITAVMSVLIIVFNATNFGDGALKSRYYLKIVIPENLNYDDAFEEIINKYTKSHSLDRVKTTNMGSLFELTYTIVLNSTSTEKQMIDEIRTRNGNLTVMCARAYLESKEAL